MDEDKERWGATGRTPIRVVVTVAIGDQTESFEADAATPGDPYHVTRRLVAGVATTAEDWVVDLAVESDRLKFRAKRDLW
jgi:hypothetical protein